MRLSTYFFLFTFSLLSLPGVAQQVAPALENLDFETGAAGDVPVGWSVPDNTLELGFNAETVDDQAAEGKQSARLFLAVEEPPQRGFANLMRSFDATAYRGKRVRFSAQVRTEPAGERGRAQLWMRVDLDPRGRGFFENMGDRPITATEWERFEIIGDVESNAGRINLGVMQFGEGQTWIDDVRVEIIGEAGEGASPPSAISERGLDNVVAFARLFGAVRYFHPSDQAQKADWLRVAVGGIAAVEDAETAEELASAIEDHLRPIAPTLRVGVGFGDGEELEISEALRPESTDDLEKIGYWHFGVGLSPQSNYKSRLLSSADPPDVGGMSRRIDAAPYQGRSVRVSARLKAAPNAAVRLFVASLGESDELNFGAQAEKNAPLKVDGTWRRDQVEAVIDEDASSIVFGVVLEPEADGDFVLVDDVTLTALTDGEEEIVPLPVGGFEGSGQIDKPDHWKVSGDQVLKSFYAPLQGDDVQEGDYAARLTWRDPARLLADPADPHRLDLGRGVVARLPLALWKGEKGTLPKVDLPPPDDGKPYGFRPGLNDRESRLAWVVMSWNTFQHFYPYFDVTPGDWHGALREALRTAALDADALEFQATLQRMVRELHDGHGGVYGPFPHTHRVPAAWSWIESRLVITQIDESVADRLAPGDVVLSIDGVVASEALARIERGISGATPQWRRYRSTMLLGNGVQDQKFDLLVRRGEQAPRTVRVAATSSLREQDLQEKRPEKLVEIEDGVYYVDLDRLSTEEFNTAVDDLAAADGVVFDLRGYPRNMSTVVLSHLIDGPITSARWEVPIVTRPNRKDLRFHISNWSVEPKAPRFRGKVAFLTDGRAISYAETYLGMVEHYELAEIVGSPTAGTNGNVNPLDLGAARMRVMWTGMRVRKHDGTRHHGVGIQPTTPAVRTIAGTAAGRDEVLERALEIVRP